MTLPNDSHRVKLRIQYDGVNSGYFCIDCDKWVVKDHTENILCGMEK